MKTNLFVLTNFRI